MNAMHGAALAAVLTLACSSDGTGAGGSCGPGSATSVAVCDNFFSPSSSTVAAGATVTWTWGGTLGHNVTFADGQQSSGTTTSGSHSRTFPVTGTFPYSCTIHSGMVGSVTVQ